MSGIGVRTRDFRWVSGEQDVRFFEAPARTHAAGLLDGDPCVAPDWDVFVDYAASWDEITDGRPQCTERYVTNMRKAEWKEKRGRWSRS